MAVYWNEFDPFAAQWLRNLVKAGTLPPGEVDERSISDVQPEDLGGFTQCHFFAGIGGWSYAAQIANWPDDRPLWTGSCPCQPFSVAGPGAGTDDPRHLWPEFFRLIRASRPPVVMGEQSPGAIKHGWLDEVADDLENEGYEFEAVDLPAYALGADHLRQRLWFVADLGGAGLSISQRQAVQRAGWRKEGTAVARGHGWPPQSGLVPVVHGVPGRVGGIKAAGNAIVPQVAAEVIAAYMECRP